MYKFIISTFVFLLLLPAMASSKEVLKVGSYNFPPFAEWKGQVAKGMTVSLIQALNGIQNDYQFEIVETSPLRRYEDFEAKRFDLIFFESIQWGWEGKPIEASDVFMNGGEVFIALKKNRDQSYFNSLKDKKIRGIVGYHYKFLNFSTSPEQYKKFNFEATSSHEGNIEAVLDGRVDLALVTNEFLILYFQKHPLAKTKLLVSKKFDQEYFHTILMRKNIKLKMSELNGWIKSLKSKGYFEKLSHLD